MSSIKNYLSLVKFSHTIFALPFACIGFTLALQEGFTFSLKLFLLVLACMVTARNSAMAFNRFIDRKFDVLNPRTAIREIPAELSILKTPYSLLLSIAYYLLLLPILLITFVFTYLLWPYLLCYFIVILNALLRFVI